MTWCKTRTVCGRCKEFVFAGEEIIKCKFWKNHYSKVIGFHADCWLANARDYLAVHPYTPRPQSLAAKGRPKLDMSVDDARKRSLLLRRYATTKCRIKDAARRLPDDGAVVQIERLGYIIEDIRARMEYVGGCPKSW